MKLGHVSLDGTKVKANASKHKAMSYGRMKQEEARLEAEVKELLTRAQEIDEEEDRYYGKGKRGDELPQELAFREGRLKKIREAKEALEKEAKCQAEVANAMGKEHPGIPEDKTQRNFTDPDSKIMPLPGGRDFTQAYNAQLAVDTTHQIIVACDVTNQPVDKAQAVPMMEQIKDNTGVLPKEMSADAGYFSAKVVEELSTSGIEPFIPPDKTRHGISLPRLKSGSYSEVNASDRPYAQKVKNSKRKEALCAKDGDCRAGIWSNKAKSRLQTIFASRA